MFRMCEVRLVIMILSCVCAQFPLWKALVADQSHGIISCLSSRLEKAKVPGIWKYMFGTMKLWVCTGAAIELMVLSANSRRHTTAEAPDE